MPLMVYPNVLFHPMFSTKANLPVSWVFAGCVQVPSSGDGIFSGLCNRSARHLHKLQQRVFCRRLCGPRPWDAWRKGPESGKGLRGWPHCRQQGECRLEIPDAEDWMYLVYFKHWTLNLMPLMVYPKVLVPHNL